MHAGSLSAAGTVYLEVGWQAGRATGSPGQGTVGRRGHLRQGHSYTPGFSGEKVKITSPQSTLLSGSHNSPVKSDDKRARECLGSSFYPWLLQQYPSNPCQLKLKTCSLGASHSWFTSIKNKPQDNPAFIPVLAQHKSKQMSGFCFQKVENVTGRDSPPSENTSQFSLS